MDFMGNEMQVMKGWRCLSVQVSTTKKKKRAVAVGKRSEYPSRSLNQETLCWYLLNTSKRRRKKKGQRICRQRRENDG